METKNIEIRTQTSGGKKTNRNKFCTSNPLLSHQSCQNTTISTYEEAYACPNTCHLYLAELLNLDIFICSTVLLNNKLINGRNKRQSCQVNWFTRGREEEKSKGMKAPKEKQKVIRVLDRERGKLNRKKPIINKGLQCTELFYEMHSHRCSGTGIHYSERPV